jgi:hypothetical protein
MLHNSAVEADKAIGRCAPSGPCSLTPVVRQTQVHTWRLLEEWTSRRSCRWTLHGQHGWSPHELPRSATWKPVLAALFAARKATVGCSGHCRGLEVVRGMYATIFPGPSTLPARFGLRAEVLRSATWKAVHRCLFAARKAAVVAWSHSS